MLTVVDGPGSDPKKEIDYRSYNICVFYNYFNILKIYFYPAFLKAIGLTYLEKEAKRLICPICEIPASPPPMSLLPGSKRFLGISSPKAPLLRPEEFLFLNTSLPSPSSWKPALLVSPRLQLRLLPVVLVEVLIGVTDHLVARTKQIFTQ